MRERTVQQIRVTSSFFKTQEGLSVYADLKEIKQSFPALKQAATYRAKDGRTVTLHDDTKAGIAFETVDAAGQQICIGIVVHEPGRKVLETYISLRR